MSSLKRVRKISPDRKAHSPYRPASSEDHQRRLIMLRLNLLLSRCAEFFAGLQSQVLETNSKYVGRLHGGNDRKGDEVA